MFVPAERFITQKKVVYRASLITVGFCSELFIGEGLLLYVVELVDPLLAGYKLADWSTDHIGANIAVAPTRTPLLRRNNLLARSVAEAKLARQN